MSLPHFSNSKSVTEPVEPIFAKLFEVVMENSKGETLDDLYFSFSAYEKVVYGKEPFIKLHFHLNENRNTFEIVADIKKVTVTGSNKSGHIYLRQIFMVEFIDYSLAQNYEDDGLLHVTFHYKILDQDLNWYDV